MSRKTFILVDTEDCAQKLRCVFYEIDHRLEILDSGTRVKVQYHILIIGWRYWIAGPELRYSTIYARILGPFYIVIIVSYYIKWVKTS